MKKRKIFKYKCNIKLGVRTKMDRPTKIVLSSMIIGLILFVGFQLLTFINVAPLGIAFNNFFAMFGIILSFIAGFFYFSSRTVQQ